MEERKKSRGRPILIFAVIILILGGLFLLGLLPKIKRNKRLDEAASERKKALQEVTVVKLKYSKDSSAVKLPGTVKGYRQATIYARVNGYVKKWFTDIGAKVNEGDLMALLETPDLDQQLQAAKANLEIAKISYDRMLSVRVPGAVAQQDIDQARTTYEANVATVRQLEATTSFKKVKAPFKGVVTERNVDVGYLINAGSTVNSELFIVQQIDVLRIFIYVPQNYAPSISLGQLATVTLDKSFPDVFKGEVTHISGALDPISRTLLTEVQVKNPDSKLNPGMYVMVNLELAQKNDTTLLIPANTLIVRNTVPQVAVVGKDSIVHIKPITIGRDFGATLQVTTGLKGNETLVTNPTDKIIDGVKVKILSAQPDKAKANPASAS